MGLSFEGLREANLVRCEHSYFPVAAWSLTDWGCAFAGEAGEACNCIKKARRMNRPPTEAELDRIAEEVADTVIYADLLLARAGRELGDEVRRKFNRTSEKVGSDIRL